MRPTLQRRYFTGALSALMISATAFAASPAAGARFELLSRSLFQKSPRDVAFAGGNAVLASGGALAVVRDDQPGSDPVIIHLEGEPLDIDAAGSIVYAAASGRGLIAIDISDPLDPVVRLVHESPRALFTGVFEDGLLLYDIGTGLIGFSITDPGAPLIERSIPSKGRPVSIEGAGEAAAVAYSKGISIITRNDSGRLAESAYIETEKGILSMRGSDGQILALFKDGTAGCWDISDPFTPGEMGFVAPGTRIIDIAAMEGRLYLLLASGKIEVSPPGARDLREAEGYTAIYEADAGHRGIDLNIMEKISEKISGRFRTDSFPGTRFAPGPDRLVTFDPKGSFWIFSTGCGDDEKSRQATFETYLDVRGFAIDLFADGGFLYLANGDDGLRTGKISSDGTVDWKGHFRGNVARDVAVDGSIAVLADGDAGLKTIDVSDPTDPTLEGSLDSPFYHSAVVTREGRAYVAGGLGGAEVIDYSSPSRPRLVWREEFSEVRGIFAGEKAFYFSDGFEGFRIYDYGDKPELIAETDTRGWNCDCFASGDLLYLAEGGNGIAIADISDPGRPVIVGRLDIGSIAREIHLRGKTLFVASHKRGITAIDVSDPSAPKIAARFPTVDDARGVFADDDFVYLASGAGGVYIFRYIDY